jgi:uncharacterized protein (DUF433 family)
MAAGGLDLYGGKDPRELPIYGARDAAACLNLPEKRVLDWLSGTSGYAGPVLTVEPGQRRLSFFNLLEAFVLDELRRRKFSLQELRALTRELRSEYPAVRYPLAELEISVPHEVVKAPFGLRSESGVSYSPRALKTGHRAVFTRSDDSLLEVSSRGRSLVFRDVWERYLHRIEKHPVEGVVRLYPFITKDRTLDAPKTIAIDPTVAFGKPVIAGTGIPTAAIYQLFNSGDRITEIAEEYDRDEAEIEAAIRYESVRARRAA